MIFFLWPKFVHRLLFTDEVLVLRKDPSLWYMNVGRVSVIARMLVYCAAS